MNFLIHCGILFIECLKRDINEGFLIFIADPILFRWVVGVSEESLWIVSCFALVSEFVFVWLFSAEWIEEGMIVISGKVVEAESIGFN